MSPNCAVAELFRQTGRALAAWDNKCHEDEQRARGSTPSSPLHVSISFLFSISAPFLRPALLLLSGRPTFLSSLRARTRLIWTTVCQKPCRFRLLRPWLLRPRYTIHLHAPLWTAYASKLKRKKKQAGGTQTIALDPNSADSNLNPVCLLTLGQLAWTTAPPLAVRCAAKLDSPCLRLLPDPASGHISASPVDGLPVAFLDNSLVNTQISTRAQA